MNLQEKVLKTIQENYLIEKGENIVIGVSGGPDSMALLHVLVYLKRKLGMKDIVVAHLNHQIREEADEETEYVQEYCRRIGVQCYVKKVDVLKEAKNLKVSTELAGRNARYDFFEELSRQVGATKIATAHHANDNAETVLMNLLRGTGTSGLKGIEKIRDGKYIRPLLDCYREEIEDYCIENKLNPRYDKTNEENIYIRNKIRNQLIPYIEREFNPNIVKGLNRLSTIVAKQEAYFHNIVENAYQKLKIHENNTEKNTIILNLKELNQLDEVIKSRVILYTINELLGSTQGIEKIHVEDIIRLCGNNIGNKYLMPQKNLKVFVKKGKVFFIAVI